MSIRRNQESASVRARREAALVAEYVARTERLAPLLPTLRAVRARPLPAGRLAYEPPQNLALELTRSILYENTDSIQIQTLSSLASHADESLWNDQPRKYFESMNYGDNAEPDEIAEVKDFESDSLAQ